MLRNQKGFTLIELLIVVVIIGILAAIAIPKFSSARERAYYSAMKSDLKSLSSQQEVHYSKQFQYTTDKSTLQFTESQGVNVGTISLVGTQGWYTQATHDALAATEGCAIYNGDMTAAQATAITLTGITLSAAGVPACNE